MDTIRYTYADCFLDLNVTVEVSNRLTLQISRFLTGQAPDRTNCLTPLAHTRRRVMTLVSRVAIVSHSSVLIIQGIVPRVE